MIKRPGWKGWPQQVPPDDCDPWQVLGQLAGRLDGQAEIDAHGQIRAHLGRDPKIATHPAPPVEHGLASQIRWRKAGPIPKRGPILLRPEDPEAVPLQSVGGLGASLVRERHEHGFGELAGKGNRARASHGQPSPSVNQNSEGPACNSSAPRSPGWPGPTEAIQFSSAPAENEAVAGFVRPATARESWSSGVEVKASCQSRGLSSYHRPPSNQPSRSLWRSSVWCPSSSLKTMVVGSMPKRWWTYQRLPSDVIGRPGHGVPRPPGRFSK